MDIKGVKGLLVEEIARNLSNVIENVSRVVKDNVAREFKDTEVYSGFVDGSSIASERRGGVVALLSAYGLIVKEFSGGLHMYSVEGVEGARKPIPLIIVPRTSYGTRLSLLMRSLELAVATSMVKQGVRYVFMDGSFLSMLLSPSGISRAAYHVLVEDLPPSRISDVDEVIESMISEFYGELDSVDLSNPGKGFSQILDLLPKYYAMLTNYLLNTIGSFKSITSIVDYSLLAIDENLSFKLLVSLLEEAFKRNSRIIWVAKDSDSRFFSRILHTASWITDASILDYLWSNESQVALRVNDVVELTPITPWRATKLNGKGNDLIYEPSTAIEFYDKWGSYNVWYFKLSRLGPVLQLSYPSMYGKNTGLEALGVLKRLCDDRTGYPKPLILVHHATRLEEGLAEGLGDSVWSRIEDPLLKVLLSRKARIRVL